MNQSLLIFCLIKCFVFWLEKAFDVRGTQNQGLLGTGRKVYKNTTKKSSAKIISITV